MVLVGVQPSLTHVPPTCSLSTSAVRIPAPARACDKGVPACPAPITMASYSLGFTAVDLRLSILGVSRARSIHVALPGGRVSSLDSFGKRHPRQTIRAWQWGKRRSIRWENGEQAPETLALTIRFFFAY